MSAPRFFASRISFYYAAAFVVGGLVTPFLPVWLQARGFGPEQIAACLAFPLLARIIFTPIGSWIADNVPNRRLAILIFSTLAVALFIPATQVSGVLPILILTGLTVTISGLVMPTLDALALTAYRRFALDYGRMRAWGSISFVVVSLGGGLIFGAFGTKSLTVMLMASFVIAAVSALALPVTPTDMRALDDAERPVKKSAWHVLTRPSFLVVVASTSLIQSSHGVFYSFGSIHWEQLGFSGGQIGVLWAVGVVAEILMFQFSGRFMRFRAETFILIGGVAAVIRWAAFPFIDHFIPSLALQVLHGLTFGSTFIGMQLAIARDAPELVTASAQGICQVISGVLLAVTTLLAGPLYARLGIDFIVIMAIFAAIAVACLVIPRGLSFSPRARGPAG